MKLPKIQTRKDLDSIFRQLDEQGFYYHNYASCHTRKIEKVIRQANTLKLDISESQLAEALWKSADGSYVKLEALAKKHFEKFTIKDKVTDLLRAIDPPITREIHLELSQSQLKQNPSAEFEGYEISEKESEVLYWRLYDLSGAALKLNHNGKDASLSELLRLTIAPNFKLTENLVGKWYTSDGVEYKMFMNGTVQLKHPMIGKLKQLYKAHLLANAGRAVKL